MSSLDGVRMTQNSSFLFAPSKAVMGIPASLDLLPLLKLHFHYFYFLTKKYLGNFDHNEIPPYGTI